MLEVAAVGTVLRFQKTANSYSVSGLSCCVLFLYALADIG